MENNESKTYRVFVKGLRQWVEVTEEFYREYTRENNAIRKREQYHNRCACPRNKWWLCDGMCQDCEFRVGGGPLSLDVTVSDEKGNEKSWLDDLMDDSPDMQSVLEDRELLQALLDRLDELDSNGRAICAAIAAGKTEREAGWYLGMHRNTYTYRRDKLLAQLYEALRDYR